MEFVENLNHSSLLYITLTVISASLLGSWHCAGMCGPIAVLMNQRNGLTLYHFGRLFSYLLSGAIIGQFGKLFLQTQITSLRIFSSVLLFLFLLISGLVLLFDFKSLSNLSFKFTLGRQFSRWISHQTLHRTPFVVGFLSFALPCSWLWTFLALAATTQSPVLGAYTLFLFWLGGIPALNSLPFIAKRMLGNTSLRQRKIAGVILLIAAIYSMIGFFI
ncbi:MAG TPA: sulfite exporter TauE/SafE family protein [Pseudobdellovibrionaceae bacterium]|nr:sulfite exporter TauE/SafE family protein [Pseudobdellovibrionaceae bacterium]